MSLRLTSSLLMISLTLTGCSVSRALNKPSPKDLSFLTRGTSRDAVRSELGDFTLSADTPQCDVHAYPEGSGGGKYARAFLYSILDLGSAGIFEIFLNPIEAAIGNDKVRTKTCYNEQNLLVRASEFGRGGREARLKLIPADDPALEASLDAPRPPVVVTPPVTPAPVPAADPAVPQIVETAPSASGVTTPAVDAAAATPALPVAPMSTEPAAGSVPASAVITPVAEAPAAVAEASAAVVEAPAAAVVTAPVAEPASPAADVAAPPAVPSAAASATPATTADTGPAPAKPRRKTGRKH